jgi:lysophospholipase L1-like esterase
MTDPAGKGLVGPPGQGCSIDVGNPAAAAGYVHSRAGAIRRTHGTSLSVVCLLLALAGCGGSGNPAGHRSAAPASSPSTWAVRIVALGDSDTTGAGDPSGQGWVGHYAALVHKATGSAVHVTNLASEGKTSDVLLNEVQSDPTTRQALDGAQIVLLGIGGADLNTGDDNLQTGQCKGRACYEPLLRQFSRNFDATVAGVRRLAGRAALIRAISFPNGYPGAGTAYPPFITADISLYQAVTERTIVCHAVRKYAGDCIDAIRAFNGPSGTGDPYKAGLMTKDPCCYPSAQGQQLVAQLLYRLGVGPLQS